MLFFPLLWVVLVVAPLAFLVVLLLSLLLLDSGAFSPAFSLPCLPVCFLHCVVCICVSVSVCVCVRMSVSVWVCLPSPPSVRCSPSFTFVSGFSSSLLRLRVRTPLWPAVRSSFGGASPPPTHRWLSPSSMRLPPPLWMVGSSPLRWRCPPSPVPFTSPFDGGSPPAFPLGDR